MRAWLTEIVTHDNKDLSAENIEALMKVMREKNVPFTRETVRRQFLDLWGAEMHADSRREAFTPDRIRLLSAAFRNHMHWSELIRGDVVISPPYKWQVLFNASDLRVMPRANRFPCRLA